MIRFLLATLLFLSACAPTATPASTPQLIRIQATAATQPWLADAYNCAQGLSSILANVDDPNLADISIRMGEPESLSAFAYQIDIEDLLIVTHRESQLQNLTAEDARRLFSHLEPQVVQVWVFASGEDTQQVFVHEVLHGQMLTSLAQVAVSPQQMSDSLNQDKNAVGILPRRWKAETMREIFRLSEIPVLALVKSEPQGLIKALLACLQK
jgi:hypothetical protein